MRASLSRNRHQYTADFAGDCIGGAALGDAARPPNNGVIIREENRVTKCSMEPAGLLILIYGSATRPLKAPE
jgi:hypothetical protein